MKTTLFALFALISLAICAQPKEYRVEVSFKDAKAGGKYIFKSKDLNDNFSDTLTLKKDGEKITFKKAYTEPFFLSLTYVRPGEKKAGISLPTKPGELEWRTIPSRNIFIDSPLSVKISGDNPDFPNNATATGGIEDDPLIRERSSLRKNLSQLSFASLLADRVENNPAKADSIRKSMSAILNEISRIQKEYIAQNPGSPYTAALLFEMISEGAPTASIERNYNALSPEIQTSKYGKKITEKLEVIKAIQPGRPAPDFTLTDIDGKTLKLSDLRGKWVLLDFWGSWCYWCRKGNPALVKLYDKYGGKDFEIIGLAARDKEEAWKKAIADDHLTWRHANLELNEGGNDLSAKYNVKSYPTKILVDPQGNISVISVGYHLKDDPIPLKITEELNKL